MPIGAIEPFDVSSKQWPAYISRLRQYIILNGIKEELYVPLLLNVAGDYTYSLISVLCAPADPDTKTFDELVRLVSEYLQPRKSEEVKLARQKFHSQNQRDKESVEAYLQELHRLASTCYFGCKFEENILKQFVSGLSNSGMKKRILDANILMVKEALDLALTLETGNNNVEKSANDVRSMSSGTGLHESIVGRHSFDSHVNIPRRFKKARRRTNITC